MTTQISSIVHRAGRFATHCRAHSHDAFIGASPFAFEGHWLLAALFVLVLAVIFWLEVGAEL